MFISPVLRFFIPDITRYPTPQQRVKCGIISGMIGIICNLFLVAVKITLAVISGSIAVAADAVNNLSDAGTGIITIAGFRLSAQPPDAEHPFGHGRTEYVAALVIALIIMGLGITFLKDSIMAIINPSKISGNYITIIIFSSTILLKCILFLFYRNVAKMINSDVLRAAAYDSLSDCIGTLLVTAALISSNFTNFPLDGCAGLIVAGMILWAGGSVLKDTANKLLGEPPDPELVQNLKNTILDCPGIDGVHDIIIHNYGENSYYATAHAEMSCDGDRFSAHDILENAEVTVAKKLPVHLLLHGDPYNKKNPEVIYWRSCIENIVSQLDSELKLYDFRLEKDNSTDQINLSFHLLVPHKYGMSNDEIRNELLQKLMSYQKNISLNIVFLKSFI